MGKNLDNYCNGANEIGDGLTFFKENNLVIL